MLRDISIVKMDSSSGYGRSQGPSLFVGGLAFNATEQDVREAFAPCGTVTSCRIVTDRETGRSKGFGFVEFQSEDSIERAVRDFNGMTICGRQVRLDSGGKGKGKGKGGYEQTRSSGYEGGGRSRGAGYQQDSRGGGYHQGGDSQQHQGGYSQQQQGGYGQQHQGGYGQQQAGGYKSSHGYEQQGGQSYHHQGYHRQEEGGYQGARGSASSYHEQPQGGRYPSSAYQSGREASVRRSRSRSLSSGTKERRHKERQVRKEQFAKSNRGWDRMPTSEEVAYQEAERAAVYAAEAHGKDITTIRADLLKQQQAYHHHNSHH